MASLHRGTPTFWMTCHCGNDIVNHVGVPPCKDAIRGATRRWHPECSRQSGRVSPCRDVIAFGVPRNANKFESTRQRILDDMSLRKCTRLKCRGATMQGRHSGCHAAVAPRHHVVTPLPSGCHATLINSMRHANAFWMTCQWGNAVVNHVGVPPCREASKCDLSRHQECGVWQWEGRVGGDVVCSVLTYRSVLFVVYRERTPSLVCTYPRSFGEVSALPEHSGVLEQIEQRATAIRRISVR